MKIGLVCPYNLFKGGGVQECVWALQAELSRRGHEVLIVSPSPRELPDDVPPFVRLLGMATDVKSPFHTTAQVSVSVDTAELDALLEAEKFDVLHFHEPWIPLLSRQILQRSTAKNIATFHAKLPDTMMSRTIERVITPYTKSVLKYLDALTAVSEPAAEYVRSLSDHPVDIIPNGIDLTKYQPGTSDKPYVFYIGRLERRKGLKYLIRSMAALQQTQKLTLVIAGDGPDREQLEEYADEVGADVRFVGRVSEDEKLRLLGQARLFCSPAMYGESFGIVLLEAMACTIPTVAGDNPGYSTVMTDTGRISLVNARDEVELTRRLDLLANDEVLRDVWQKWAAKNIAQYSYKRVVDHYEKLYKSA